LPGRSRNSVSKTRPEKLDLAVGDFLALIEQADVAPDLEPPRVVRPVRRVDDDADEEPRWHAALQLDSIDRVVVVRPWRAVAWGDDACRIRIVLVGDERLRVDNGSGHTALAARQAQHRPTGEPASGARGTVLRERAEGVRR